MRQEDVRKLKAGSVDEKLDFLIDQMVGYERRLPASGDEILTIKEYLHEIMGEIRGLENAAKTMGEITREYVKEEVEPACRIVGERTLESYIQRAADNGRFHV